MSDTTESTTEPIEPPSKGDIERRMTVLEQWGETVEAECHCGTTTEHTALPGESVDVTICRDCAERHLRKKRLL
jgi:hypothetical protein